MIIDCNMHFLDELLNISEIIFLDDVATIDFDSKEENDADYGYQKLTEEQLKVEKYKLAFSGVKVVLAFLRECSKIQFNNYTKSIKFMDEYNLTEADCLEIIHNLKPEDYYANTRSFSSDYGGNNLIIFEPKITVLKSGKKFKDLVIYIKIDLDKTTNKIVALASIHSGAQNSLPYIEGDFSGVVESYYKYPSYDDTIYDFLLELLEKE